MNSTTSFNPAIGLCNLDYTFPVVNSQGYVITYLTVVNASSFKLRIYAIGGSPNLTKYAINYLGVSANFNDFYIWIDGRGPAIGRLVSSATPALYQITLIGTTLPAIANVKYLIPMSYISLAIVNASTLLDIHCSISIVNTTTYNLTISA